MPLSDLPALLRIKQWVKNGFLFFPLMFDLRLDELDLVLQTGLGFLSYSLIASTLYIVNDYRDIEEDRQHPKKRYRPLASGRVSPRMGLAAATLSFLVAVGLALTALPISFLAIAGFYFVLNLLYSNGLKHIPIVDICIVSLGFVLRIFAGSVIADISPSVWIIVMSFLFALFIAMAKRRDDVLLFLSSGQRTRKVIDGYNLDFLNIGMAITGAILIMAYLMYCVSPGLVERLGTDKVYYSLFFVIVGVLRYLQVAFVEENSGDPTELFYKDRFLQLVVLGWLLSLVLVLYVFQ